MQNWMDEVKRDLTPFADPGIQIHYSSISGSLSADWFSRGEPRSASFHSIDGEVRVSFDGTEMSFRAFLAGPKMSDLLGVARMMLQSKPSPFFVDTRAKEQIPGSVEQPALDLLCKAAEPQAGGFTNVVFVNGDAGAGKTEVLKQLVRRQATRYTHGEADYLFLYVNAQGRALARLDEALATEIQDLRATTLTYHVVPALARNGNLVPVIDGFDELLGVLGYEDAFSSLRRFLDELDGHGSLIASARSTYYQQEFLARSGRESFARQGLQIEPLLILPWGDDEFGHFLALRFAAETMPRLSEGDFRQRMGAAFAAPENHALRSKPFFVAKTSDLVLAGTDISGGELLDRMVDGYVERERTEKLLDRNGTPLLTAAQILHFVQAVSEEMWVTEARTLDSESVRILAELAFPSGQNFTETDKLIRERAPTMAFFAPASGRARVEFEHELFFSYFLGNTIQEALLEDERSLYSALSRSVLPENAVYFAAKRLWKNNTALSQVVEACAAASTLNTSRSMQARENAGSLVAAVLRVISESSTAPHGRNIKFRSLVFAGESFSGIEILDSKFTDVEFRRADLTKAALRRCSAERVGLHEIIVEPTTTIIELAGLDPLLDAYGIRIRQENEIIQIFRHDLILKTLIECGLPADNVATPPLINTEILDLLERLLRKFERSNLIWPSDQENKQLANSPHWPDLERLLIDSGIITEEEGIPHKGSPRRALRRNYLPYQIMSGDTDTPSQIPNVRKFWTALRERHSNIVSSTITTSLSH